MASDEDREGERHGVRREREREREAVAVIEACRCGWMLDKKNFAAISKIREMAKPND